MRPNCTRHIVVQASNSREVRVATLRDIRSGSIACGRARRDMAAPCQFYNVWAHSVVVVSSRRIIVQGGGAGADKLTTPRCRSADLIRFKPLFSHIIPFLFRVPNNILGNFLADDTIFILNSQPTQSKSRESMKKMPPFSRSSSLGISNESLRRGMTSKNKDDDSIGSDTFREQRRQAYEETCETDEQLFDQHNNIQSIFDNRHHDLNFVDDDDGTGGSSLGGYSNFDDNASKGSKGSIRTRDELRMSLIARRRRLAQMESAMDGEGSLNMSLKLSGRNDGASLMSSLVDSMVSMDDSIQGSLLSKMMMMKKKKKKKTSKSSSNDVKKKSKKKKSKSKEKDREKKKGKHKRKEKEKRRDSKKDKKKKKSSKGYESSSESSSSTSLSSSSSESESEQEEEYSKRTKRMPQNATKRQGGDKDRMRRGHDTNGLVAASRADAGRVKSVMAGGGKSVQTLDRMPRPTQAKPLSGHSMERPSRNAESAYNGEMCAYHPDIRMRKKSALGGWRIVLQSCPKCAGHARKRESGGDRGDRSVRSRGSTRQQGDRQLSGSIDRSHRTVSSSIVTGQSDRRGSGGIDTSNRSGKRSVLFSRHSDMQGSASIDRSHPSGRSSAATMRQLDTRERPPDHGLHRQTPLQVAPSQRQHSNRHGVIESSEKSSTSAVARPKPTMEQRPTSRREDIHQRPSRGESAPPPIKSLPPQPRQTQRGVSNSTQRDAHATPQSGSIKPVACTRGQQPTENPHQSSRHSAISNISPGSGKEPSLLKSLTNTPISSHPESAPTLSQNLEGRSGHERRPSLQRMSNMVNFDPPVDEPGSGSDFAVSRRSGGRAYNRNQASSTFIEELDDVKPNARSQQSRSKTLPNSPHNRRMSLSINDLDSLSAKDLMNFVLAESAHFDKNTENWGDLQRALMEQVRRLSLDTVEGNISGRDIKDRKFSVLREVVKSYMISQNNVNSDDRYYGHSEHRAYKFGDEARRRDMIKADNQDDALNRIASLKPGDPAFIRRTTGKWTYAKVKDVASDSIAFIVDVKGSLKSYKVKYWVSHVRTLKV